MSLLDLHTLRVMEFDRVLAMVQARAPSSLGKEALAASAPTSDRGTVLTRQRETAEMCLLRDEGGDPTWEGSRDVRPELERLKAESSWIEPAGLQRVAGFAEAADRVRKTVESAARSCPELARLAAGISPFGELSREIRRCVNPEGEIDDGASVELRRTRRGLESTRRDILTSLKRFFARQECADAIQEKIVTLREERYVIPVKAGSRNLVPGIVHDRSASGQTLFIEPGSIVEKNNRLRELMAAERQEILKVLQRLGEKVRERRGDLQAGMAAMALLEAAWARAVLSAELDMSEPVIFEEPGKLDLKGARHPLLGENASPVVPMDFSLGVETKTLVLTGPNTGGKTVALKTVGLLCLMAQSGLQIPALPGSGMSCFSGILADIGDEQSIQQSLSTFSGHMKNVVKVLDHSGPESLVLLDELGAGTDPSEGAALGMAILEELHARGGLTVATTHHNAVKVFASVTPGVENASMEFDPDTLQPTYHLVKGIPGRSQAFHIAAGLELAETVIARARRHQTAGEIRLDLLMSELENEKGALSRERAALQDEKRAVAKKSQEQQRIWERKLQQLEKEGRRALRRAEQRLEENLRVMEKGKSAAAAQKVRASMRKAREVLREHIPSPEQPAVEAGSVKAGDRVFLRTLRAWGVVEETGREGVAVTVDGKRCSVPFGEIEKREAVAGPGKGERQAPGGNYSVEVPAIESSEIYLRGLRTDEALTRLDRFMEHALLNNLREVSVIHGKGTGRLQEKVTSYLAEHRRVESFAAAPLEEGGAGVTKVILAV